MKEIAVSDVRNFVLMGHTGSGKTTLVDALLFKTGQNDRMGSVAQGSSMADYSDAEKSRKISIAAKPFQMTYKSRAGKTCGLTVIDTPGYADFFGQVIAATHAADAAVLVVDASAGVQVGTRRAWQCCEARGLKARAFLVTGIDKENVSFDGVVEQIQSSFGGACVPVVLPSGNGVVDVLAAGDGEAAGMKNALVEKAAETDDTLIEKYLGGEELSADEVARGLVTAVAGGTLVPIMACAALKDVGVTEFLETCLRLLPSPEAHPMTDADGKPIDASPSAPFCGFVWRTVSDPFIGQMSFIRVLGGTLKADTDLYNVTKGQSERVPSLVVINGKKQITVESASAGDIVSIPKLKVTRVNDTLGIEGAETVCAPIQFPNAVSFAAVTAQSQADEDKIGTALARVCDEDPTLRLDRNKETHELVLQGLGDVHLEVAVEQMKSRSNVSVTLSTPKVPYRETVTARGEGHYKHKKQTGGRGQFGEVYLRVQSKSSDDPEWFEDAVVGGVIPNNFIPAVQKGVVDRLTAGAVAGYPVQDVKVTVYDGSFHPVDSSEIAFKIAGSRALKEAMLAAKPVLLEPIMTVRVTVPDQFMGDINGDLNHKRGRILGMEPGTGVQTIIADVPQAELFRYTAELRSITGGQGSFEMAFSRYDIVPSNVAQKVIAAAAKKEEEEE